MPTNRTPLKHNRSVRLAVSDEALAVYLKMKEVRCTCEPEIFPPDEGWDSWTECAGCQRWADFNRRLLRMLGKAVPVYEVYVVPPPDGRSFLVDQEESRQRAFERALAEREAIVPIRARQAWP